MGEPKSLLLLEVQPAINNALKTKIQIKMPINFPESPH